MFAKERYVQRRAQLKKTDRLRSVTVFRVTMNKV